MIASPNGGGVDPAPETRSLRSRPRANTSDQGSVVFERSSNGEATRTELVESEQPAKRLKISQESLMEQTKAAATPAGSHAATSMDVTTNLPEGSGPLSAKEPGEVKRRSWTLPKTKRASSLNLHNHPVISHPVGIAIWLLQKIDQARKSNASDDERSSSTSLPTSPGGIRPTIEIGISSARHDRSDSATAYSIKPSSLNGAQPLWGQPNVNEHEDDTARRQAQRHRKTKQRSENWAKNKENDVVARAKLEAKKKYGTHAQQEMERKAFVDERVRDDYGRLLGRQTTQFADAMAQLAPFQVGHSEEFVRSNLPHYGLHHPYVQAGKLLLDVLPALAEPRVSERSQRAADALLSALEHGNPDEGSFFTFIDVLSDDEIIQRGIDKVLGQLLSARPEDRRASRSQASPAGGQLAPPPFSTSPDSTGLSLKRLTWKEPTTVKDNNFALQNRSSLSPDTRITEQQRLISSPSDPSAPPPNLTPPPSQIGSMPRSSPSSAYLTPSTIMPPPPPAQARSSGRERKPTAKVLAAGTETPSRQSAASPAATSRPPLTRNARSIPRVPSKLGLSEVIADQEETPTPSTPPTAGRHQHTPPKDTNSATTTADQHISPATISGPLIPPVVPRSLQQPLPNISQKPELPLSLDPQLTVNLLQLAEIAANMSESEDDDLEMEQNDIPYHERLIRALEKQSTTSKWHIATANSVEQSGRSSSAAPPSSVLHSSTTPVNVAPARPTSLPPVNTIISTKEAQAASSFFKSLVAGEPITSSPKSDPTQSTTMNLYTATDRNVVPAENVHAGNTMTNGITYLGRLNAIGNGTLLPQIPGPEPQVVHGGSNKLIPKTQLGGLNTNGHGNLRSQFPRREGNATTARHATTSPQRALLPSDRKRKIEDEGNDIAISRLRSHAESRGLPVDPKMSFDQLNAMIDNHEKVTRYGYGGANGQSMLPASIAPYSNGLAKNGNATYGSTGSTPAMERPQSADGLRRLAPNPAWPGYSHAYPPYNLLPAMSPATQYTSSPNSLSNPDGQRFPNGHATNTRSQIFQFIPPKQPGQFNNGNSPVVEKTPPVISGDDPRQQHQKALNGGPPGGGAVINSRTSKKQQNASTAHYKFLVNSKETPIAQSQPKRGGQLMTF